MPELVVEEAAKVPAKAAVKQPVAQFNVEDGDDLASAVISTLQDLERVAPKIYKALMESIATMITGEMRASQERIKKKMRGIC